MIKVKRLSYALLLVGFATTLGHSQETTNGRLAKSSGLPAGQLYPLRVSGRTALCSMQASALAQIVRPRS
jgi:hypothetical protein